MTLDTGMPVIRWMTLIISIVLIVVAMAMRFQPAWFSSDPILASDVFAKVGIVLFCLWLAWPAIEMIGRAPSGTALIVGLIIAVFLFLFQRRTIYLTGPALGVAIGIAVLVGWIRKFMKP